MLSGIPDWRGHLLLHRSHRLGVTLESTPTSNFTIPHMSCGLLLEGFSFSDTVLSAEDANASSNLSSLFTDHRQLLELGV